MEANFKRLLLADGKKCPYACTYCFASFSQYEAPLSLEDLEASPALASMVDILYPACDSDVFARRDGILIIRRAAKFLKSLSVSTKARLTIDEIENLKPIADALTSVGSCLKIGISFATKYRIPEIEPGAAQYAVRLQNLMRLAELDIHRCAILKPLLAEIPVSEYFEILNDVSPYVQHVLIGGEYLGVDKCEKHFDPRISHQRVNWIPSNPLWPIRYLQPQRSAIIERCRELGLLCFESDLDLMGYLITLKRDEQRKRLNSDSLIDANELHHG